jgi:predicted transglutaminase-like cysteine proteinase
LAAQSSLPGSALYGWKVNVNEEVRASLAVSGESKAEMDADRAGERLSEAEKLSVEESVDAQTRTDIEMNFKAFADRTQARIKALADVDARAAADVASNFEFALNAHEKVLARLEATDSESNSELRDLQAEVDSELRDTVKLRTDAETKIRAEGRGPEVKAAAEGKITAATNVIAEVTAFINAKKNSLSADAVAKAEARLAVAQSLLDQANAKLTAGAYADAFILGNQTVRTAQGAKLLIEAEGDLEVDLHLDGQRASPTPTFSPRSSPKTEGLRESETHIEGRVDIEVGF